VSRLDDIVASKREEVLRMRRSMDEQRAWAADLRRAAGAPLGLIAEVKFKSPSAGELSRALGPKERAMAYARAGATMVSVLCDRPFFDGSWDDLAAVRAATDKPVLAKEFVVDEAQIDMAARQRAHAVLLIARIVTPARLAALAERARSVGVEPLVEVVDEAEVAAALAAGALLVGVNARDLDTLAIDPARAARVLAAIPEGRVAIHLSGLKTPADVREIARGRADLALVGEALMRQDDPEPLLRELVRAAGGL
jgi:indole-3-glycerol phosphate synthase